MTRLPARRSGLLARSVGSEAVVYDDGAAVAHALSPLATSVFGLCDGRTTVASAATSLAVSEADIETAVTTLDSLGLVEVAGMTRRSAMQKAGLVGAGALAVTIAAPLAAAHATSYAPASGETTVFLADFSAPSQFPEPAQTTNNYFTYTTGQTFGVPPHSVTVTQGDVDLIEGTYYGVTGQAIDLDGSSAGGLASAAPLTLTQGTSYTVTVQYKGNPVGTRSFTYGVTGGNAQSQTVSVAPTDPANSTASFSFTATATDAAATVFVTSLDTTNANQGTVIYVLSLTTP